VDSKHFGHVMILISCIIMRSTMKHQLICSVHWCLAEWTS